MVKVNILTIIISAILLLAFFPQVIFAQQEGTKNGTLEVSPAILEVIIDNPEVNQQIAISYTNHSSDFLSLELFPIDFKQKDGIGAISFLGQEAGSYSYSLSSFLSFEARTVELGPRETKAVNLSVKDRKDLSPGGHYAAVIAKVIADDKSTSENTSVSPSLSTLILLRKVGGERFNLSLKDVDFPDTSLVFSHPKSVKLTFQNEGNIHLVPYGRIEISDIFGRLIYKGVLNSSSFRVFPSSRRFFSSDVSQLAFSWPISINTMRVDGQDSLKKTTFSYRESYLYINPFMIGILFLGVVAYFVWRFRRKRLNKSKTKGEKKV